MYNLRLTIYGIVGFCILMLLSLVALVGFVIKGSI